MKRQASKIILTFLLSLGIWSAATGLTQAYESTITIIDGQDPNGNVNYNIYPSNNTEAYQMNSFGNPIISGFQAYCIEPHVAAGAYPKTEESSGGWDIRYETALKLKGKTITSNYRDFTDNELKSSPYYNGSRTPPIYRKAGTYSLSPRNAYIVYYGSANDKETQKAIWHDKRRSGSVN